MVMVVPLGVLDLLAKLLGVVHKTEILVVVLDKELLKELEVLLLVKQVHHILDQVLEAVDQVQVVLVVKVVLECLVVLVALECLQ